jgi:CheY-like chemotaxis protein
LADDSVTIQKVVNLTFADEGIEVLTVGDGDTAMARFPDFRPDIVLADVNMPGLNGYRICESLRQREDSANVPVILLVGSFEPFDEKEARRVGANDWITKPFQSIRQLVTKVSDLLDHPERGSAVAEPVQEEPVAVAPQLIQPVDDIEKLYQQSVTETAELPRSFRAEPVFGDAGMDDDMIEMSYAGGASEGSVVQEFSLDPPAEPQGFEYPALDTSEPILETPPEIPNRFEETLPVLDFRPAEVVERPEISFGYEEMPPIHEESVHEALMETVPDFRSEPENGRETTPLSFETRPNIDEINVLEIPASGLGPPADYQSEEENIVTLDAPPPLPPAEHGDMSPEFIDAVARKVIQKISENVIRQIAWQVVPQVAESVIREKINEDRDK